MASRHTVKQRLREGSVLGIVASAASAVAAGYICTLLNVPGVVQGTVTAGAAALPAAIEYSLQSQRRDDADDAARIAQGELRRPIGLVVALFVAALVLSIFAPLALVWMLSSTAAYFISLAVGWIITFFIASYASHYLGKHPYRWTAIATTIALVAAVTLTFVAATPATPGDFLQALLLYLPFAAACFGGALYGRRHHAEFLAKKLARVQRKAATASPSKSTTPNEPPSASGPDALDQLKKLAELRDAGVLTEDEFLAKKTEILGRI